MGCAGSAPVVAEKAPGYRGFARSDSTRLLPAQGQAEVYKVLVLGPAASGKTQFLRQLTGLGFSEAYEPTRQIQFSLFTTECEGNSVHFHLWDVGGQCDLEACRRELVDGLLLLVDSSQPGSLEEGLVQMRAVSELVTPATRSLPAVLVANKCDLTGGHANRKAMRDSHADNGFAGFVEVSARDEFRLHVPTETLAKALAAAAEHPDDAD